MKPNQDHFQHQLIVCYDIQKKYQLQLMLECEGSVEGLAKLAKIDQCRVSQAEVHVSLMLREDTTWQTSQKERGFAPATFLVYRNCSDNQADSNWADSNDLAPLIKVET